MSLFFRPARHRFPSRRHYVDMFRCYAMMPCRAAARCCLRLFLYPAGVAAAERYAYTGGWRLRRGDDV